LTEAESEGGHLFKAAHKKMRNPSKHYFFEATHKKGRLMDFSLLSRKQVCPKGTSEG